jgi:hypothetical protein
VGVVIVNKKELDHVLLWPVPEYGFSGKYPAADTAGTPAGSWTTSDPWAITLHHLTW